MVQIEGEGSIGSAVGREDDIANSEGGKRRDILVSVATQFRSWLAGSGGTTERSRRAKELLKALVPTSTEYRVSDQDQNLFSEEDALPVLRVGNTVMIVADQISPAVSQACERIRTQNLQPLVILDAPLGPCHRDSTLSAGIESAFEVLDLEQFATAVAYKRAWRASGQTEDILGDVIDRYGFRTTGVSS